MEKLSFLKRPWARILLMFFAFLIIYLIIARRTQIWFDVWDLILLCVTLPFWLFFFSQFVLPVRKPGERFRIFERLLLYISGLHGSAIFIENGIVRANETEKERKGPGVIWLDTGSAAVLRTPVAFTRTVGPGAVFTKRNEYVAQAVDLHELNVILGPGLQDNDDPFGIIKDHPNYNDVQARRWETSAMTRDGIEVIATIFVTFKLLPDPGSENNPATPFGYSETNVFKYAVSNASNIIITRMVVDIWREYLRKYRFNQLFEQLPNENITLLQKINQMVNARLDKPQVSELDEFGRDTSRLIDSIEFQKMRDMGITGSIVIRRLLFPPEIEQKLVSQWTANWLKNAQKERDQVERQRTVCMRVGQEKALKEFADYSSQEIGDVKPTNYSEALEMMVHSTLKGVLRNTTLQRRMTSEPHDMSDIIQWLREKAGKVGK
jgi:hypothetical protein